MRGLTGVPERTQRQYEQVVDVARKRNIAIGERHSKEAIEERAWHMTNSYGGPHSQRCKGRQKKINRQLRELVMKGMRANGREQSKKLFWAHGAASGRAYNRNPDVDVYWQSGHPGAQHLLVSAHADLAQALPAHVEPAFGGVKDGGFTTGPVLITIDYKVGETWDKARVLF